jgi:hypothetical protein
MVSAGLVDVDTAVHARSWPGGSPGALHHAATISQLRTRILEAGMTGEQLDRLCGFLRDRRPPSCVLTPHVDLPLRPPGATILSFVSRSG